MKTRYCDDPKDLYRKQEEADLKKSQELEENYYGSSLYMDGPVILKSPHKLDESEEIALEILKRVYKENEQIT